MDRYKPRHGTPAPFHNHMAYIADSCDRAFRDAFADYLALADDFFIAGCDVTETPSGTSTVYAITSGSACYKGEFLRCDAHSITKLASQVVYLELYEDAVDLTPVLNLDGSSDNVMIRRRIRLAVGPVYPVEHMVITAPRKEALDRLRFKGRIVLPGMILPYYGVLDHFSGTGLGIEGGPMDGWAICNGLNGTVDLRGQAIIGATNVPSSGAAAVPSIVGGSSDPGELVGSDKVTIEADNLPEHQHGFDERGFGAYPTGGGAFWATGATGGAQERIETRTTEANTTTHQDLDVRQASRALVYIQSIAG